MSNIEAATCFPVMFDHTVRDALLFSSAQERMEVNVVLWGYFVDKICREMQRKHCSLYQILKQASTTSVEQAIYNKESGNISLKTKDVEIP